MTVSQKGLALAIVPLVFQLAFVLVVIWFQVEQVTAERWAIHTKDVIARAREIHTAVSDAHSGLRGYVISRDPSYAEPLQLTRERLPARFGELDELVRDSSSQTARLRRVRESADALLDWQDEAARLVRDGGPDEAAARVRTGQGNQLMEEFRAGVGSFLHEEERLNQERLVALDRARSRLNVILVTGGLLAVGCSLSLAYVFRRVIARRFAALEDTARRLGSGENPGAPLDGADEIARIDRAFRAMAAELTRTADRVRDLYDHAPCGYHSVDESGTVIAMNPTELRWLGYSADEVLGRKKFSEMLAPASREIYSAGFTRLKEHGVIANVELELVRRDGSVFPVLISSSALLGPDGAFVRSRSALTDMSERKRAEAAVRLFSDLASNIPIGLLIYQLDGDGESAALRVRSGNRDASRLLGISLEQAAGHPVMEVFPAIPPDQLRRYSNVALTGQPDDFGEFRYGDSRVTERWWAVLAFPLPERSVGIAFQDVTARKQAEAEVRRLNEELEDRVRARTAELAEANRDLVHKNAENEMFVYSVSHDLRSPLVNLQGFSKELEKGCQALGVLVDDESVPGDVREKARHLLTGKMAKSIGFIQSAVLRLSGIIDALLRLSRAGRVEYRLDKIDMAQMAGQVIRAAQGTITERGATIRAGDLPPAWGDRTAIEQVFGNLVGNALTYLDPSRPGVIEIGCLPADGPPEFRTYFVRDNGLGIPEGHRQKIFQAFQRAHPGVGNGEGLGLAIVSRVAERHRGRVWVESKAGAGSVFFVSLPTPPETGGRGGMS